MGAWRGWYHINGTTYGTWQPGDPRGWRSKKHKRHVEGDYRNPPPPGAHGGLLEYSMDHMSQQPVRLERHELRIAGEALVAMLLHQGVEVLVLSIDEFHFHGLARFADNVVRPRVGRTKKHATFMLQNAGREERVWQTSNYPKAIRNRRHQLEVFRYIRDHEQEGAHVWTFHDPEPRLPQ